MTKTFKDYLKESGLQYYTGVKKYGKEGMTKIQSAAGKGANHEEIGKIKDKYDKTKKTDEGGMSDLMIGVDELVSDFTTDGDKESGLKMPKDEVIQAIRDSGADPMEISFAVDTIKSDFDDDGNYKYAGYEDTRRMKELAGVSLDEETYDGDDFYNAYGDLWFNEDDELDEAEYQGRKVQLGKPMRGDVKKFKVYVRDPKTKNIKKVNFGDPNMKIKKSNPARRRSFRARHNCDNPGPRTKARYWSCRKW